MLKYELTWHNVKNGWINGANALALQNGQVRYVKEVFVNI